MSSTRRTSRRSTGLPMLLTLGMTLFIAVAVILPIDFMSAVLDPLNAMLWTLFPGMQVSAGKLGHTLAFFLLTWCAVRVSGRSTGRLIVFVVFVLLFSVGTEMLQLLVDGRSPKLRDIVFDLTGVLSALLLFYFPRFLTLRTM